MRTEINLISGVVPVSPTWTYVPHRAQREGEREMRSGSESDGMREREREKDVHN